VQAQVVESFFFGNGAVEGFYGLDGGVEYAPR